MVIHIPLSCSKFSLTFNEFLCQIQTLHWVNHSYSFSIYSRFESSIHIARPIFILSISYSSSSLYIGKFSIYPFLRIHTYSYSNYFSHVQNFLTFIQSWFSDYKETTLFCYKNTNFHSRQGHIQYKSCVFQKLQNLQKWHLDRI